MRVVYQKERVFFTERIHRRRGRRRLKTERTVLENTFASFYLDAFAHRRECASVRDHAVDE